jgi:hypothetical protein
VNAFTAGVLSPYLNYHRPCHFPTEFTDEKGKIRKRYRYADMMTPYEKLKSLPNAAGYLRQGVRFDRLDAIASAQSDNEAARQMNEACLSGCHPRSTTRGRKLGESYATHSVLWALTG